VEPWLSKSQLSKPSIIRLPSSPQVVCLYQLWCFYHDTIVYHDSKSNDKMENSTWIILYIVCFIHIMPHQNKSKHKFIIVQWIVHTRRTIMWSTQTTSINKSFNFMIILRFKCLIYVYHDNKKLYHITIMDLCDRYITLSILLHITKYRVMQCVDSFNYCITII